MALTTYSELKSGVKNWLNRGTELDSFLDDICLLGEKWIERNIRVRAMETSFTGTIGGTTAGVLTLPSDWVEAKNLYIDMSPAQRLSRRSLEFIYDSYPARSGSGIPKFFAREGDNLIFGPYSDSAYVVKGTYYKRLTSIATTLNGLYTSNPDLYLMAALSETSAFLGDDARIQLWQAKRDDIARALAGEDNDEDASGSALVVTPG
jgi:hypothetical protein